MQFFKLFYIITCTIFTTETVEDSIIYDKINILQLFGKLTTTTTPSKSPNILSTSTTPIRSSVKSTDPSKKESSQHLIVIALDGFDRRYLKPELAPNIIKFGQDGVQTQEVVGYRFASNAFAIFHSIATGKTPKHHGVVGPKILSNIRQNYADLNDNLSSIYNESRYVYKAYPIWTWNEDNGGISAISMWPGADFPFGPNDTLPSLFQPYNTSISLKERFNQAVNWLKADQPPNLVMMYVENLDKVGHAFGPISMEVKYNMKQLDEQIAQFQNTIKQMSIANKTNIILVTDHGMAGIPFNNFIPDKFCEEDTSREIVYGYFTWALRISDKIFHYQCSVPVNLTKYFDLFPFYDSLPEDFPSDWIYLKNFDMTLAHPGYAIKSTSIDRIKILEKQFNINLTENGHRIIGIHGFPNENSSGIFMANGPIFKTNFTSKSISLTDYFWLFAKVLNITSDFKKYPQSSKWLDCFLRDLKSTEPLFINNETRTASSSTISPVLEDNKDNKDLTDDPNGFKKKLETMQERKHVDWSCTLFKLLKGEC